MTQMAGECGAGKSLAVASAIADACGVADLPDVPRSWARSVADDFLADWSARSQGLKPARATTPVDAIRQRMVRWRLAPRSTAALEGLIRSGVRQVLRKRSRYLRAP